MNLAYLTEIFPPLNEIDLGYFFEILPSMFLIVISMVYMLLATGIKFKKLTTSLLVAPFLVILIILNVWLFAPLGLENYDTWSILTVFIPQFVVAMALGKRKGVSKVTAIINSYVSFYIIILLRNVIQYYSNDVILEYIMYGIFIPAVFIFIKFFYSNVQDRVESLVPKFSLMFAIYSIFIYFEFYMYRYLIKGVSAHILRLDIFGVAIISVYIVSIVFMDLLVRQYHKSFEKAKEKEQVDMQMGVVLNQFKIRDEKDKQLRILRHDMKHILVIASTLIKDKKYDDAVGFINQQIQTIDSTKVIQYCKDTIINAVICYYREVCEQNKIKLIIKINNVEDVLKIKTSEVGVLLSNCFENAINASKKLSSNRVIIFKFINKKGHLAMQMKNYHNGDIQYDSKNRPTNPKENHGVGTKSIRSFVEKHNLFLDYEIDDTTFTISIIFN